ncbi:hypothetical protein ACFE04_006248 [Oxalis oulophora]
MESRQDLNSLLSYLPLVIRSSSLFWPSQVVEALKAMSSGPHHSHVSSGEILFMAISDIRDSLSFSSPLAYSASLGYSLYFDELMSRSESDNWFGEVLPALANLLLRLPSLLENHYRNADEILEKCGVRTGLRLLGSQEAGMVLLSQELVGALLACSFFCLFPNSDRGANHLPTINFDHLFAILYDRYSDKQENKIKCLLHYFGRICSQMPASFVSYERKVHSFNSHHQHFSHPEADFWSKSNTPLCTFKVQNSGLIEDHSCEALEVDFANEYLGGGALHGGCVQEEIRFMINPELIAGMIFLPCMADNEAIEIIGAERFCNYKGYATSFRFSGDHVDKKAVDSLGRRHTRIIAIDALCNPGKRQYKLKFMLRETNKAFCGFFDQSKCAHQKRLFDSNGLSGAECAQVNKDLRTKNEEASSATTEIDKREPINQVERFPVKEFNPLPDYASDVGIATGNWGCGAFGGDPELKAMIQWLAASQALRPFILYYTFGVKELQSLEQASKWILLHQWTVGDLWSMLVEYLLKRFKSETDLGFLTWLLPSLG